MLMNDQSIETSGTGAADAIVTDIAIVGGGLAGSLAAAVLARAGHRIVLIDKRAVYPEEFRVEKLGGRQLDILRRLGLIDAFAKDACLFDTVLNIRQGKLVDVSRGNSYGIPYAPLVAIARRQVSEQSSLIVDQVLEVSASDDLQRLSLASGK